MNTTIFTVTNFDGLTTDYVQIDRGNGEFTSMTKETYEAQQAAQAQPQA
jgi:hypothetical protein